MNQKKAFIFDVDGVLVDSVPYHFEAWRLMFADQGITFTFQDYVSKVNGIPRLAGIRSMLPDISNEEAEKLAEIKQQNFLTMVEKVHPEPLPSVIKFLSLLKKNEHPAAAASSSKNAPIILEKAHLTHYFDHIISGHDFTRSKPDPEIFLTTSTKLGVTPNQCIVIEDAATGIMAGKNAGMMTIGVLTSKDQEISKIADITLSSLVEYDKALQFFGISAY